MEALHCLKYLLEENNFLCKIVLKGPYFSVPLCTSSGKFVKFAWSGNLYEFHCLCFELGPAPRMFSKLLEVPIALLRRLNIRLVIYLDDILLMGRTLEEILMSRDTLIFLLQHLGFIMNLKSVLKPAQQIEFLGLKRDFDTMALALTEEKMKKVILECQNLLSHSQTTALELKKLIDLMSRTVQAVLPARLQLSYLQQQQIQSLFFYGNTITKPGLFIPSRDSIKQFVKTATSLMGGKFKITQWKITKAKRTKFSDTSRCIKIRLGCL